ncbi:MAG TPA: isoamylase early set domain-containing protein [Bacteroidales bacterium]|nr:isoamylase early set domain-containing protein [Bacteroidales bacterium]
MCITKRYSSDKKMCKVTFILPQYYCEGISKAYLVGEFNNWDPHNLRMKKIHGKYMRSLQLQANKKYQFRYLLDDNTWKNEWDADALAPVPIGSWYNSVVVV